MKILSTSACISSSFMTSSQLASPTTCAPTSLVVTKDIVVKRAAKTTAEACRGCDPRTTNFRINASILGTTPSTRLKREALAISILPAGLQS
jgi:hypothetical protein